MSTPTKRIAFHTLGCKLNYSETSTISRDLIHNGFEKVDYQDTADIYVIDKPINSNDYFIGVPSPAAAGLVLVPLILNLSNLIQFENYAVLSSIAILITSILMVSKIPTISLKNINFSKNTRPWIILLIAVICIGLISNLWLTLIFITSAYIISIFYTVFINLRTKN